jgi:hypothetical protein
MNNSEIIELAEKYLEGRRISFVRPGTIGRVNGELVEVVFLIPEALDPNLVVDPPDVGVWVNIKSKFTELVDQM